MTGERGDGGAARVGVIALGSPMGSDDAAALLAAERLRARGLDVFDAGRPGPGLLDLLDPARPVLVLDVVRRGVAPGEIVTLPLEALASAALPGDGVSSHGVGLGDALRLARALGRALPRGVFLGLGGASFGPGDALSPAVEAALDVYVDAAEAAARELGAAE